jgi:hypothetical protein
VGVTTGRGTGDDLVVGTGAGLPGRGVEKAGWLVMKPPRVNIVSNIMLLVFIFLLLKPLRRFRVATATERSSPGQLALDCSRGMPFVPAPFSILSPFLSGNGKREF